MAHFERHCQDCMAILGNRHEAVNRWMDELFRRFGANHREWKHHWRGVWEAKKTFGEEGAKAVVVHIVRDCGAVPKAGDYEKTNLGIVIASAFLVSPAKAEEQPEEEFLKAVEKTMKKGQRDGVFQKAGSSTVEPSDDNREVVGSSPTPPTKFERSKTMAEQVEMNGRLHDVCDECGEVKGHGCLDSKSCSCGEPEYNGMNGVCCQ